MKKPLKIIKSPRSMRKLADTCRRKGKTIGLVPTMGALHDGHLSLIRKSAKQNDFTIVSIFVNPTQFGPDEDFGKYPKAFKSDCDEAQTAGADMIFHPSVDGIYPDGFQTFVDPGPIADKLEGAARPGHLRGVATVCVKLFSICKPHRAYFGQKDAQQLAMIKSVTRDLNLDLKIVGCPIVRTKTGIAMSSRHSYLAESGLKKAVTIYDSLKHAKRLVKAGETDIAAIRAEMTGLIKTATGAKVEYISFNSWASLDEVNLISGKVLISLVVIINTVRLLDNIIIHSKH
ncbi:MAG: pantoate--beta-alanine ligase [candidate division Zixibacteria bacterium]|nr:pantoate--beta-alanine ligase [candidate division Zixibacteria bacterium]